MKTLTCKDFGGPCDVEITGSSFEEMGKNSHAHVMEKINSGDEAHLQAANKMKHATAEERQSMMTEFEKRYNEASDV